MNRSEMLRSNNVLKMLLVLAALGLVVLIGASIVYVGKIYPGVKVNGVDIGGLDKPAALAKLHAAAESYNGQTIPIDYNKVTLRVPVRALAVNYTDANVDAAYRHGRTGSLSEIIRERLRALVGRQTLVTNYTYDDAKLTPFVDQVDQDVSQPVANARLSFDSGQITVTPSQPGHRLDRGILTKLIDAQLASMTTGKIQAPVYMITPTINEDHLSGAKQKAATYVAAPLTVKAGSEQRDIDQATILSWIDVVTPGGHTDMPLDRLKSFYSLPTPPQVNLAVSQAKVGAYVAQLAGDVDQAPVNAALAYRDGQVVVAQASHEGITLDQAKSTQQIIDSLGRTASERTVSLTAKTVPAEVSESTLSSLGIKELISEGQTFFPGSPSTRLINVRTGAKKYNGVLLKPGEVFSFGKILGDVGPEQGYVPELVILDNHEEKQYGGGLCQVSSTAYRAALLAGLPILERHNHSFAISYYTNPYGVPGVDATIYYPAVDFKFKNDTGHYILIQTHMEGTTLTFDYFGTKTKSDQIRGPQFISGSSNAEEPSHTVFWRDVLDLSGNVVKTDEIHTWYESSKKFPIEKQFN